MNSFHSKLRITFFLGILFISFILLSGTVFALEIMIKEQAIIKGDMISLKEIASFTPDNDIRIPRLGKIEISASPAPGNSFRLNNRLLIYKISSSISNDNDITVKLPEELLVQRSAQYIDSEHLKRIFKDYVIESCPHPADKIQFERISTPKAISLPEGSVNWEIIEKDYQDFIGNIAITIDFIVNGKLIRKAHVSGMISVTQEVMKTARRIKKGEIITENDLIFVTERKSSSRNGALTDINDAVGKKATRTIQADQIMTTRMVEVPPLVRKGNGVLIKAENKDIRISTLGTVLEDGQFGDNVRVVNISSGKEIFATVKGPGLVEVTF